MSYHTKNMAHSLGQINVQPLTQSQISLNHIGQLSLSDLQPLDTYIIGRDPNVKKYEVYESPEDLLALSVVWKRLRDDTTVEYTPRITSLLDSFLFNKITQEDRNKADEIRDYYSKKLMMLTLHEIKLTSYRQDLQKFISTDGKLFRDNMLGLAYHLPTFYNYDNELDQVKETVNQKLSTTHKLLKLEQVYLKPVKKINRKSKRKNQDQYWFKENLTDNAVLITIESNNVLGHIWDNMFKTQSVMKIEGVINFTKLDNFEIIKLKTWNYLGEV
jgi:hypothetical protein